MLQLYGLELRPDSADVWVGAALFTVTAGGLAAVVGRRLSRQLRHVEVPR